MFALKYGRNRQVMGRKAMLVAKEFTQILWVDFFATYASVVWHELLCMNLVIGTMFDYEIWQVNYATTYLKIPTQAPILMEQPEEYAKHPSEVFKINIVAKK